MRFIKKILYARGVVLLEHRKLIKFGGSSHIISLPNNWLRKNNLNKGDLVYLNENGNNELVLSSEIKEEKKELREITVDISDKSIESIDRVIRSAYIKNYDIIKIIDKNLKPRVGEVKEILQQLAGLEIVEETSTMIKVKDFLNVKEISIIDLIRQTDIIIRSMLEDSKASISGENLYDTIFQRDLNVNRLYFLIFKVIQRALNDPDVLKSFKLTYPELLANWWVILNMEKIGDESKRIAGLFEEAKETKVLKKERMTQLNELYSFIINDYLDVMKAFYTKNEKLAERVAIKKDENIKRCNNFLKKNQFVPMGKIIEKFKNMESNVRHIVRSITDITNF